MFISKLRAEARKVGRITKLSVELLENRLQPGSVLTGLGFSPLGASLVHPAAGLFVPQDNVAQVLRHRLEDTQDISLSADLALLTPVPKQNGSSADTNATPAAPPAQEQISPSPAPSFASDLAALSAGGMQVSNASLSGPRAAPAPAPVAVAPQATPISQPLAAGNAAASTAIFSRPQGGQLPITPAATATPIPSANLHSLTASVITHVTANEQGGINTAASLNWTTYVAGGHTAGGNVGKAAAVDSSGNLFVTGYTDDGTTKMAFVAEYNSTGSQIAFTAFQAQDPTLLVNYINSEGHAIAVDVSGGVYVAGKATDAFYGNTDGFILKFDPTNQLMPVAGYGGGIIGVNDNSADGVVVDGTGATVTGTFGSTPTEHDIFAVKYDPTGSSTIFANIYPFMGSDGSNGNAIALDSNSNAYLAGSIHIVGGDNDILVMQIDNTAGGMNWYFTQVNPGDDVLNGIAVDQNGQATVVGTIANAAGGTNGYIAQVKPDGSGLVGQLVISNMQAGNGISLDTNTGNTYMAGSAPDASGNLHVLVQKFDGSLNPGDSSTIMGSGMENASGVAFDPNFGNAYVVGTTTSTDLSTDGTTLTGTSDAFLSNVGSFA